ncbi:hypothetical protein J437_LFUL013296 [Ladona fulva]|uniref:G-protein coupled receptors family 2 profile 1 domain-containing protein n=1 Tax=Ladona fulva TaxID=123851 RepID=A0A8K0P279_LADFU|nr:hypothetical protein J437_LFUL013296 [Ladona fulva]
MLITVHKCQFCFADRLWCPLEFDGWTCINATPAGENAIFPCPYFVVGFDTNRNLEIYSFFACFILFSPGLAYRECTKDGTWFVHPESNKTWSNYTTCVDFEDLEVSNGINNSCC